MRSKDLKEAEVVLDNVGARFFLLYSKGYIWGSGCACPIVCALHTKIMHHNTCKIMLVLPDLMVQRQSLKNTTKIGAKGYKGTKGNI
jgi:hypothetical protein